MWIKILLLFFVYSFLFRSDNSFDQDLGRHLKLGEIIWQTKQVPKTNLFSYSNPDFPFINTHWLFEVWVYLTNQVTGLNILLAFKVILLLIAVLLILKIIPKGNQALFLPIGFIFLHVLRERTEFRPEIFSFLFTAGTYYILEKYLRGPTKLIFLLPAIQFLWINTHIYFFVGLILQAIFLLHLSYKHLRFHPEGGKLKILAIAFGISVLVSLINPNGLNGLLYPLKVNQNYGYTIVENQTMFLLESINFSNPNFLFVKISLAILALSLVVGFIRKKPEVKNILLATFGAALALLNVRGFPYLALLSLPAVLQNFGPIKQIPVTKILSIIFAALLILESYLYLNGSYYRNSDKAYSASLKSVESGKKALDFVLNNNLPGPIYNNFDIGSYIIYRGYPKLKVFVDGRPEAYPKEFFQSVYIPSQSEPQKFKELEQKFNFRTIIFSHTDQTPWGKTFLQSIIKNPDWKVVYIDDFIIILMKDPRGLKILDLADLRMPDHQFDSYLNYLRLSLFLIQTGNIQSAQKFAQKGLSLNPKSPLGNALFGVDIKNKFFW